MDESHMDESAMDVQPNDTLTSALQEEDAILDKSIVDNVRNYVNANGSMQHAAHIISESYEGLPDLLRVVLSWAAVFMDQSTFLQQAVEDTVHELEGTVISRLDVLLSRSDARIPAITAISNSPRWKPVFDAVVARHPRSVIHNALAREARLSAAAVRNDALDTPRAFLSEIIAMLTPYIDSNHSLPPPAPPTGFITPPDPVAAVPTRDADTLHHLFRRVSVLCSYDEGALAVSLRLFASLTRRAGSPKMRLFYRRLAQHVRAEAVSVMESNGVTRQKAIAYVIRFAALTDAVAANVEARIDIVDAVIAIVFYPRGKDASDQSVSLLLNLYGRLVEGIDLQAAGGLSVSDGIEEAFDIDEQVMLARFPCHIELFRALIAALFSHEHRPKVPNARRRLALSLMVAYAGEFAAKDDLTLRDELRNPSVREVMARNITKTLQLLQLVVPPCEGLPPGAARFKIKAAQSALIQGADHPIVAHGLLAWARDGLHGGDNLIELRTTAPIHLAFLNLIAQKHAALRPAVLEVLREAFMCCSPEMDTVVKEELRDRLIDCITGLTRVQMGPAIVRLLQEEWAPDNMVDPSHLRRCIIGMLDITAPPYDEQFARNVHRLLRHERVAKAMSIASTDHRVKRALRIFNQATADLTER